MTREQFPIQRPVGAGRPCPPLHTETQGKHAKIGSFLFFVMFVVLCNGMLLTKIPALSIFKKSLYAAVLLD